MVGSLDTPTVGNTTRSRKLCILVVMVDDKFFREQLKVGDYWAEQVAKQIRAAGKFAVASPTEFAETEAEREHFKTFDKDITLSRNRVLEVKSRNLSFTADPASFPYETAFMDTVEGWEAKDVQPTAVAVVSQVTGAVLIAPVSRFAEWKQSRVYDRVRGFHIRVYECPRGLLKTFGEFVEWL